MNIDKNEQNGGLSPREDKTDSPNEHTYRSLGESGLVEDEEGNIYGADEVYGPYDDEPGRLSSEEISARLFPKKPATHPDWVAIYDPRYCGPSLEDYINRMERLYSDPDYRRRVEEQEAALFHGADGESTDSRATDGHESTTNFDDTDDTDNYEDTINMSGSYDLGISSESEQQQSSKSEQQQSSGSDKQPSSESEQQPSSDSSSKDSPTPKYWLGVPVSRRTLIFYFVSILFFLFYVVLLIIKLVKEVIHLFEI